MNMLTFAKAAYLGWLGLWLCLAAWNNLVDAQTNRTLLGNLLRMKPLRDEPAMGHGLWHRTIDNEALIKALLFAIVLVEFVSAGLLLWAAAGIAYAGITVATLAAADLALTCFGALWCVFLTGGLWFGYWMKTWHVQQVHFTLVTLSLLGFVFVHLKP